MELGLNLLWALLASFVLLFWAMASGHGARRHCGLLRGALLLSCVLLLLFPAISISDDLHGSDSMEDPSVAASKLRLETPKLQAMVVADLPASTLVVPPLALTHERVFESPILPGTTFVLAVVAQRAPPLA